MVLTDKLTGLGTSSLCHESVVKLIQLNGIKISICQPCARKLKEARTPNPKRRRTVCAKNGTGVLFPFQMCCAYLGLTMEQYSALPQLQQHVTSATPHQGETTLHKVRNQTHAKARLLLATLPRTAPLLHVMLGAAAITHVSVRDTT